MSYLYYPGCSLKSTGRSYEESMLAVFDALNLPIKELEDWNCCGATAYMSISELKAFALCARNFALAEKAAEGAAPVDLVAPCAACYLGLNKAYRYLEEYPEIRAKIDAALESAGLHHKNPLRIRHPLDLFANDIKPETIKAAVRRPLTGLKVACYYGCQIVRPYADFDSQENPVVMDKLLGLLGAEVVAWPLKTRCCGGSLTGTIEEVGLRLSYILLKEALRRGCDVIATACPLCQFNLECYQKQMKSRFNDDIGVTVVYFTQLMGVAFDLSWRTLGLHRLLTPAGPLDEIREKTGGQHVSA
jgi:heterodisulfide reductase subunit B